MRSINIFIGLFLSIKIMKFFSNFFLELRCVLGIFCLGLAVSAGSAAAIEREFLGTGETQSLISSPEAAEQLNGLFSAVRENGSVRVIIGLRVPFAPEGKLSATSATQQRTEISAAQREVLDALPSLDLPDRNLKLFETIPFLAIEVTEEELAALTRMSQITSIEEDQLAAPTLAQSVPLIGASGGTFGGFDGSGQTVAILDTGVDKNHPDLAGRVVSEACYSTTNSSSGIQSLCPGGVSSSTVTNSAMPYASGVCPSGECDHGTHVAGIAAGAKGVARGANIIAVQVFSAFPASYSSCQGTSCVLSYDSDQILGLERINALKSSLNIAAVNMSLGGGRYTTNCDANAGARKSIIDTLRSNGIATVISSGNNGYHDAIGAPACISSAVSVGSTWDVDGYSNGQCGNAEVDSVACYSNSASFLNLLAPGSLINAPIPNNGYGNWNGTSMAAPHVAGAWAVLKQKKPTASVTDVLNALTFTGKPVTDSRNGITKPRIRVPEALNSLGAGISYYNLSVVRQGDGFGRVASTSGDIDCGSTCSSTYTSGTQVTLVAQALSGSTFVGWGGACSGTSSCTVSMTAARDVTATFNFSGITVTALDLENLSGVSGSEQLFSVNVPSGAANLKVEMSGGTGDADLYVRYGQVPTAGSIDCSSYNYGNTESCLFTEPTPGVYYIMLQGYTTFSGVILRVTYQTAAPQSYVLLVSRQGSGSGTVISTPAGINCGSTCSSIYGFGTQVTLVAQAAPGSAFTGWGGACAGKSSCIVGMSGAQSVIANFNKAASPDITDILNLLLLD